MDGKTYKRTSVVIEFDEALQNEAFLKALVSIKTTEHTYQAIKKYMLAKGRIIKLEEPEKMLNQKLQAREAVSNRIEILKKKNSQARQTFGN
ncbi:MAG: hypothetical protein LLG04_04435 [Parachlamydia sp.]|nr:hypothetical protein [Parachlamydia sp.]